MKNVVVALLAVIFLNSCEKQSTTKADTILNAVIEPKLILRSKWEVDYSVPTSFASSDWFSQPAMYFNETTGFFKVGIQKGKFRKNEFDNYYEVHFTHQIKGNKVVFEIIKVLRYKGFTIKLDEETGQTAITTAKELLNFVNLDNGIRVSISNRGEDLEFNSTEPNTRVPFATYKWRKTN